MKIGWALLSTFCVVGAALAQEEVVEPELDINWISGPAQGKLATISTIEVPEGCDFVGADEARLVMESMGNIVSGSEIGLLSSVSNGWFALFQFDPVGYVKDDDKDQLDADKLIASLREGQVGANEQRRAMQVPELEIDGWFKEPFYNDETQNLEWCTQLHEKGVDEPFANHNIRILGRYGVTRIILVADLDELDVAIPELAGILESYDYLPGNTYAEYRKGDKVAKYGLTALVAGGAAAVALKSGFFKYIWKGLVIGAVAVGSFFKKLFKGNK